MYTSKTAAPGYKLKLGNPGLYISVPSQEFVDGQCVVAYEDKQWTVLFEHAEGHSPAFPDKKNKNHGRDYVLYYFPVPNDEKPKVLTIPRTTTKEVLTQIGQILKASPGRDRLLIYTDSEKAILYPYAINFSPVVEKAIGALL